MGNFGAVAIEPVKVIPEVGLEAWELKELALVACLHSVLKEFVIVLVIHWLIVVTSWLALKSVFFACELAEIPREAEFDLRALPLSF